MADRYVLLILLPIPFPGTVIQTISIKQLSHLVRYWFLTQFFNSNFKL